MEKIRLIRFTDMRGGMFANERYYTAEPKGGHGFFLGCEIRSGVPLGGHDDGVYAVHALVWCEAMWRFDGRDDAYERHIAEVEAGSGAIAALVKIGEAIEREDDEFARRQKLVILGNPNKRSARQGVEP